MKRQRRLDPETLRIFIVLGLMTGLAVLALQWALNAPVLENSRIQIETPASK